MEYVLEQSLDPVNSKTYKNQTDIKHLITKAKQTVSKQKAIEVSETNKSEIMCTDRCSYILDIFSYFISIIDLTFFLFSLHHQLKRIRDRSSHRLSAVASYLQKISRRHSR